MASLIGQTVSHYKILEKLGEGGMGVVYKAEDTRLKRAVALKFLPAAFSLDPEAKTRFKNEAEAASALDHPNICNVHDIDETPDGQIFICMACYDGQTLKKMIEQGPLDIDLALDIAIQVAEGLSRAHEAGIVHRDLKPTNIFITAHGEVKILDFGLARVAGRTLLTKAGTTIGTAAYMSPEQARGEQVDQKTDIWSLGVVMYEMLTGHLPFTSDYEQALVYSILNENPKPIRQGRAEVPEVVEQIVLRAMGKQLEDRYQQISEFLADVKIARGKEAAGGTIAAAEAAKRVRKKKLTRNLIAAGLAAAILAIGVFVVMPLIQDQALASHPRAIAFISLENKTGEESLEYLRSVLPDVLSTTLGESKYVRVTRSDRMRELMKEVGKDTVEFIDRETGSLLCRRAGIDVMCVGSYTKAGPLFLAELELIDVNSGGRLGSPMKARGREVESFLKEDGIVDDLARQISHGLGVSQMSAQAALKPVAEVSSISIEAQRYYLRGKREYDAYNFFDARRFLELAVKSDSTFAIAWFWLGAACGHLGETPAKSAFDQAVKNASRATEREKFVIANVDPGLKASLLKSRGREDTGGDGVSWFKALVEIFPFDAEFRRLYANSLKGSGKLAQAIAEYEKTLQLDPAFLPAYNELAYSYISDGQGDKAMQMLERYAELEPGDWNPLHSAAECLLMLGRFDEGIAKCEEALKVQPDERHVELTLAKLHFMKEEYEEAVKWSARASEMVPAPSPWAFFSWWRGFYLVWSGRLGEAEETLRAIEQKISYEYKKNNITEANKKVNLGRIYWLRAWCAYEKGDWKKARLHFSYLSEQTNSPWLPQFCLGLVDVQQGKMDSIDMRLLRIRDFLQALSQGDTASSGLNEETGRCFRNALQGAYLLAAGRPAEIRPNWTQRKAWLAHYPDSLEAASWPLYVPWGGEPTLFLHWVPRPFDILPRAYIDRGMIDSAIASYELALKKPLHFLGPIIPRYYYRLARLYEQKGMKDKAIENYTQFLKVWEKADPIYKEPADARARLAKLRRGGSARG